MKNRQQTYENRTARYQKYRDKLQKVYDRISYLRGASALLCVLALWEGSRAEPQALYYGLSALFLLSYGVGVGLHRKCSGKMSRADALLAVNREGLLRLQEKWGDFPADGGEFLDPRRPYLLDLNLLGPGSLFQMLQCCVTRRGAARLAAWLGGCEDFASLPARQEAVRELAPLISLRQRLLAAGKLLGRPMDPEAFLQWTKTPSYLTQNKWLVVLQRLLVLSTWTLIFLTGLFGAPPFWMAGVLAQLIVFSLTGARCREHYLPALSRDAVFLAYGAMFALLERRRFRGACLKGIQSRLYISGKGISSHMKRLERINGSLGLYSSLLHPFLNIFFLWDIHFLYQLEKWKDAASPSLGEGFEALGEAEALASLAAFSFDHPDYAFPEVAPAAPPLAAEALGHPLIPAPERVSNDFQVPAGGFLALITGSNMSGKSTFIRTVGVNLALAFSGGPVAARRFTARPCRLLTCIQVQDSLRLHLSHFYAEVRAIKEILQAVEAHGEGKAPLPVLYLIDEIFSGTNTKERLLASRGIILKLALSASCGLVSTHDLELVTLARESDHIRNFHFKDEIDPEGRMVFDYRLREGPVSTTNALELLRREGIYF